MLVTNAQRFKLSNHLYNAPQGATGQLKRLDSDHVALLFDDHPTEDLVLDVHDTDCSVWAAIEQKRQYARGITLSPLALAAVAIGAFLMGWLTLPQPMAARNAIETVIELIEPM